VCIGPAHRCLQHLVQFGEGHAFRHDHPAPYVRLDVLQLDAQLDVDGDQIL
jgi:hypothetical protein